MPTLSPPDPVVHGSGSSAPLTLVKPAWVTRSGLLHLLVRNDASDWTLELDGELDRSNVAALEQEILLAEAAEAATITIDLRRLDFTDLSGVRAIVRAHSRSPEPGRVRIVEGPRAVRRAFRLAGLDAELLFETG